MSEIVYRVMIARYGSARGTVPLMTIPIIGTVFALFASVTSTSRYAAALGFKIDVALALPSSHSSGHRHMVVCCRDEGVTSHDVDGPLRRGLHFCIVHL